MSQNTDKRLSPHQLVELAGVNRLHLTHLISEPRGPYILRRLGLLLSLIVFAIIYWMTAVKVPELTQAQGEIIPKGFSQVIQHYDGGTLKNLFVKEGQIVQKGEALLELNGLGLKEEKEGAEVALNRLEKSKDILQEIVDMRKSLVQKGLSSKMEYLKSKKDLSDVTADIEQQKHFIEKLNQQLKRLVLYAPTTGVVKGLEINTIGQVIKSGETLMEIIPTEEELLAEVYISPTDIGHVAIGQKVHIKVSSYDFGRYGTVGGEVKLLSASTVKNDQGVRFYKGQVLLDQLHVGEDTALKILPGMTVEAGIVTGEKSVLEYLLKPIHHALNTGLTER